MTTQRPLSSSRRQEFGIFLRSRRERLSPDQVGLPSGFRRRTPGLRREEVALLAGVGTTWYTWLEQGRDVRPSPEVLSALADALKLDPTERHHLFLLNDRPAPTTIRSGPEYISRSLRHMLDCMKEQPAYVLGRRWDILAWNQAASVIFGDYARLQGDTRNIIHMLFMDEQHRNLLCDWEQVAATSLAMFRATSVRYADNADFERLIGTLRERSSVFTEHWDKRLVLPPRPALKRIEHPVAGNMQFEYATFSVAEQPDMQLVVFTPDEGTETHKKLEQLLAKRTL